jgi:UDP-N-acetyl-2-amino-2-deoxyglucuronate dehydrogenase
MAAIEAAGGTIVAACDISDSAGILDSFSKDCRFTTNPGEFFKRHLYDVDCVVICTPNYLHCSHAIWALEKNCDVVLEKPIAVGWDTLAGGKKLLHESKRHSGNIYPVLQLRYHPEVEQIKMARPVCDVADVEIDYAVWRGDWYDRSWKGRERESGGLLLNLGIHLFDLCLYLWGDCSAIRSATRGPHEAHGRFRCARAEVRWRVCCKERKPHRVFRVDNTVLDMTAQIGQLHGRVYEEILAGRAFDITEAAKALQLIDKIKEKAG